MLFKITKKSNNNKCHVLLFCCCPCLPILLLKKKKKYSIFTDALLSKGTKNFMANWLQQDLHYESTTIWVMWCSTKKNYLGLTDENLRGKFKKKIK